MQNFFVHYQSIEKSSNLNLASSLECTHQNYRRLSITWDCELHTNKYNSVNYCFYIDLPSFTNQKPGWPFELKACLQKPYFPFLTYHMIACCHKVYSTLDIHLWRHNFKQKFGSMLFYRKEILFQTELMIMIGVSISSVLFGICALCIRFKGILLDSELFDIQPLLGRSLERVERVYF